MVSPDESIPKKSDSYLFAQSVFFVQFNDVDFYVEDADRESLYFCILSKLFSSVRIERIFPLGGKRAVIEHAQRNPSLRKSVYLVDKDFDDLLGTAILSFPNLIYLDRYCIENYTSETRAIYRLIVAQKPSLTVRKARNEFDAELFLQRSIADLRMLFLLFFLVQKHNLPGVENAGQSVARFTDDRIRWRISNPKIQNYRVTIERNLSALGIDLGEEVEKYETQFELDEVRDFVGANISGKYLVLLTLFKIHSVFRTPGVNLDSATLRLAEYCRFQALGAVAKRIAAIIRGPVLE